MAGNAYYIQEGDMLLSDTHVFSVERVTGEDYKEMLDLQDAARRPEVVSAETVHTLLVFGLLKREPGMG